MRKGLCGNGLCGNGLCRNGLCGKGCTWGKSEGLPTGAQFQLW